MILFYSIKHSILLCSVAKCKMCVNVTKTCLKRKFIFTGFLGGLQRCLWLWQRGRFKSSYFHAKKLKIPYFEIYHSATTTGSLANLSGILRKVISRFALFMSFLSSFSSYTPQAYIVLY